MDIGAREADLLDFARHQHATGDFRAGLTLTSIVLPLRTLPPHHVFRRYRPHSELNINAIHYRSGQTTHVSLALGRRAGAFSFHSVIAARARVGGCHQHEGSREFHFGPQPGNHHFTVFQRPTQRFRDIARHLREFIQKQHAVLRQRHLAGQDVLTVSAADYRRHGRAVMRSPERAFTHKSQCGSAQARHGIYLAGFNRLRRLHPGHYADHRLGKRCLS